MTGRPSQVIHLRRHPTPTTTYCGRVVDRRWLTDETEVMTCGLCRRSLGLTGRIVQGTLL